MSSSEEHLPKIKRRTIYMKHKPAAATCEVVRRLTSNPVSIKERASTHCRARVSTPEQKATAGNNGDCCGPPDGHGPKKGSEILMITIISQQTEQRRDKDTHTHQKKICYIEERVARSIANEASQCYDVRTRSPLPSQLFFSWVGCLPPPPDGSNIWSRRELNGGSQQGGGGAARSRWGRGRRHRPAARAFGW